MANFRILIADDDEDDYFIIREVFNQLIKHDITHVGDGKELLEFLNLQIIHQLDLPDLILLDINMPKIDGVMALKILKSSPLLNHIPVVMYSTSYDPRQKKICSELGANGFISKSCHHDEIIDFASEVNDFLVKLKSDPTKPFVLGTKGLSNIK